MLLSFIVQFPWWYKNQFPQKMIISTWVYISRHPYIGILCSEWPNHYYTSHSDRSMKNWYYQCLLNKTVSHCFKVIHSRLFIVFQSLVKVALSGLRQFLATEKPLKMIKNAFYFTLKALFVLKLFKFLSWLFGHVENRLD